MKAHRSLRDAAAPADPPAPTPSIYEVARRAAVSVATVSRVLNGKGPVRAATRERVLAAVSELEYVPHGGARSLSTRRTMLIGVVLPDMHGEFFSEIVRGIDRTARAGGYHLLVSGAHDDLAETAAVLQALHGRVDGLILMAPGFAPSWLRERLPRRLPVVLLNPRSEPGTSNAVLAIRIDNRRGARLAVEHLLAHGHRDIAFVSGPAGNTDAAERQRGYEEALRLHGLRRQPRLELLGDFSEESGGRAGHQIARLSPRPTAVFAANDAMAMGCLAALREDGVDVPRDLSLVGFDDIPTARHLHPPLTTVRVPIAELGQRAMSRLLESVEGDQPARLERAVIAPTLAIRASVAAAPGTVDQRGEPTASPDVADRSAGHPAGRGVNRSPVSRRKSR